MVDSNVTSQSVKLNLGSVTENDSFPTHGMFALCHARNVSSDKLDSVDLTLVSTTTQPGKYDAIFSYALPSADEDTQTVPRFNIPMVNGFNYMTIALRGTLQEKSSVDTSGLRWKFGGGNLFLVANMTMHLNLESYQNEYLSVKYTRDMPAPVKEIYSAGQFEEDKFVWYTPLWSMSPHNSNETIGTITEDRKAVFATATGKTRFVMDRCGPKVKIKRLDPPVDSSEFAWVMGNIRVRPYTPVVVRVSGRRDEVHGLTIITPPGQVHGEITGRFELTTCDVDSMGVPGMRTAFKE